MSDVLQQTVDRLTDIPRPLTLSEISASRPGARSAKRLSPSTITRWILFGCPNRSRDRIRLKAERCGGRWLVYEADLAAFFAALAADPAPVPEVRSPDAANRAAERAGRKLAEMGA